jgi:TonB family protein
MKGKFAMLLVFASVINAGNAQHLPSGEAEWGGKPPPYWRDLRRHQQPEYSFNSGETGSGLFRIRFKYDSGYANRVVVLKSTGHHNLDEAAIHALLKWSVKPRTHYEIDVPLRFGSSRSEHASNPFVHLPPPGGVGASGRP